MKKKNLSFIGMCFISIFFFISCMVNTDKVIKYVNTNIPMENTRKWSILVYMSADSDLEYAALEDLYEMECSKLNTDEVSVFILLDRSKLYDTSNDNWSGTRLYRLQTRKNIDSKRIISEEIDCPELNLKKGGSLDLDLSSGYVLSKIMTFIYEKYPAEKLGFIMWGHGTGWRSSSSDEEKYKGFAYEETSKKYMTLKQFGNALKKGLNGKQLDFLGLDTCFSGEIEVMYELKEFVKYAVGTEGLLLMSGWNYKKIFDKFQDDVEKDSISLINNIVDAFASDYSLNIGASIVGIDMKYMDEYFYSFDEVMKQVALNINTRSERDYLANLLFSGNNNKIKFYSYGKENSDIYLDINSIFSTFYSLYSNNNEITNYIDEYNSLNKKCVIREWASNGDEGGLGVYYGTLTAGNLVSSVHPAEYVRGKSAQQLKFVSDSLGYIASVDNHDSFLGKIFYKSFEK